MILFYLTEMYRDNYSLVVAIKNVTTRELHVFIEPLLLWQCKEFRENKSIDYKNPWGVSSLVLSGTGGRQTAVLFLADGKLMLPWFWTSSTCTRSVHLGPSFLTWIVNLSGQMHCIFSQMISSVIIFCALLNTFACFIVSLNFPWSILCTVSWFFLHTFSLALSQREQTWCFLKRTCFQYQCQLSQITVLTSNMWAVTLVLCFEPLHIFTPLQS